MIKLDCARALRDARDGKIGKWKYWCDCMSMRSCFMIAKHSFPSFSELLSYCNDDFSLSRSSGLLASIPLCIDRTLHSGRFFIRRCCLLLFIHLARVNVFTQRHDEFSDLIRRSQPMCGAHQANAEKKMDAEEKNKDTSQMQSIHWINTQCALGRLFSFSRPTPVHWALLCNDAKLASVTKWDFLCSPLHR